MEIYNNFSEGCSSLTKEMTYKKALRFSSTDNIKEKKDPEVVVTYDVKKHLWRSTLVCKMCIMY